MWTHSFRPEVEDDLVDGALWYDEKRPGLGDEFLREFSAALLRILTNPLAYAIAVNGLRPCRMHRFDYIIHFVVKDRHVVIIAVMGSGRDDVVFVSRRG